VKHPVGSQLASFSGLATKLKKASWLGYRLLLVGKASFLYEVVGKVSLLEKFGLYNFCKGKICDA
jgi:hypothetical protein